MKFALLFLTVSVSSIRVLEPEAIDMDEAMQLVNTQADIENLPSSSMGTMYSDMTFNQWQLYDNGTQLSMYREMEYERKELLDMNTQKRVEAQLIQMEISKMQQNTQDKLEEASGLKNMQATPSDEK